MNPVYEISTLADIVEKIPPDRIPAFMEEASFMLSCAAQARATTAGLLLEGPCITLTLPVRWTDDGKDHVNLCLRTP